jgi:DNA-binding PadR family transcriptional regulator
VQKSIYDQLPLTETTFYILLSLTPGKKHGYAIMKDVETISDGRITLGTGTLYGALKRLLDNDWIERIEIESSNQRERKAYQLTDLGQKITSAETERVQSLAHLAQLRLQGGKI